MNCVESGADAYLSWRRGGPLNAEQPDDSRQIGVAIAETKKAHSVTAMPLGAEWRNGSRI
jgi:hypothetical protein